MAKAGKKKLKEKVRESDREIVEKLDLLENLEMMEMLVDLEDGKKAMGKGGKEKR